VSAFFAVLLEIFLDFGGFVYVWMLAGWSVFDWLAGLLLACWVTGYPHLL